MVSQDKSKPLSWHIQGIKNCQKHIRNDKIMVPKNKRVKTSKIKFSKHLGANNQTSKDSLEVSGV
jgi:hypothetical protein